MFELENMLVGTLKGHKVVHFEDRKYIMSYVKKRQEIVQKWAQ